VENAAIARVFETVADLLEIEGANLFRVRAYRTAARTIAALDRPIAPIALADPPALREVAGIGADLADKIATLARTGHLPLVDELRARTPDGLIALVRVPGIGPKKARLIYDALGVGSLAELEEAARAGRLAQVRGLGKASEQAILAGLARLATAAARVRLVDADAAARPVLEALRALPEVAAADIAGGVRRRADAVSEVVVVVSTSAPERVIERLAAHPGVRLRDSGGVAPGLVELTNGLPLDVAVAAPGAYGAMLYTRTGSAAHVEAVSALAAERGLTLLDTGVFRGTRRVAGEDEASVLAAIGLPWIPPELREGRGEVEAARAGRLPRLVQLDDIRGDLQMHTTASDGRQTLAEMAQACRARGYEYMAVTDHTQAVRVAGGMAAAGFRRQFREIAALQAGLEDFTILKSAEVDILEDGSLDLDDETLAELDVVVASIHSQMTLARADQTRRIVRALAHPRVHILGHPNGRMIGRRPPMAFDFGEVVAAAREYGVLLEVNAQPRRLDITDEQVRMALDAGVQVVISTDAHRTAELDYMRHGVMQARRGWCTAADVANTRPLGEFRRRLRRGTSA
jgi:DNA polymerase (family 10)